MYFLCSNPFESNCWYGKSNFLLRKSFWFIIIKLGMVWFITSYWKNFFKKKSLFIHFPIFFVSLTSFTVWTGFFFLPEKMKMQAPTVKILHINPVKSSILMIFLFNSQISLNISPWSIFSPMFISSTNSFDSFCSVHFSHAQWILLTHWQCL